MLEEEPPSLIIGYDIGLTVKLLDEWHNDNELWQIKAYTAERKAFRVNGEEPRICWEDTIFAAVGFRRRHGSDKSRYHACIDPNTFQQRLRLGPALSNVVGFARALRGFCERNDLAIRSTAAAIAQQLLRDPRFWPEPRRKVPKATNRNCRPHLPGNYYELKGKPDFPYPAHYVDYKNAHHTIAAEIDLPHPDDLYAHGYFADCKDKIYARRGDYAYDRILKEHGLLCVKAKVPHRWKRGRNVPEDLRNRKAGAHKLFLYTNEIAWLEDCGLRIEYIIAAWTAEKVDEGMKSYAKFCIATITSASANDKAWLKPLLLAAYGILAARPRKLSVAHKRGAGYGANFAVHSSVIYLRHYQSGNDFELPICNVVARGLIEAETRKRVLRMADYAKECGARVLSIYADGIFMTPPPHLFFMPENWRIKEEISRIHFQNAVSFVSENLTRQPGKRKLLASATDRKGV